MSGQPTNGETGRFFTVAGRLARSVSIAAGPRRRGPGRCIGPSSISGQPTERGNGRFFTVAAGFARSVSIAAGRGAAAIAAASARHHEWTISRRETAGFHRRGRADPPAHIRKRLSSTLRPHPLPQGDLCESRFGAASRQLVALGPGFAACARESSGWSWRSLSQPRFPGRLQRTPDLIRGEWKAIRDPAQDSRSAAYSSFRRGLRKGERKARRRARSLARFSPSGSRSRGCGQRLSPSSPRRRGSSRSRRRAPRSSSRRNSRRRS